MKEISNQKFLFDQNGNAYINGVKVGKVVACVEIAPHVYIKLPRRGYFSLKVKKDAWKK